MALQEVVQRLRLLREEADITQKEIAEKIGVSRQQVSQIETGYRGTTIERLETYAQLVGCRLILRAVPVSAGPEETTVRLSDLIDVLKEEGLEVAAASSLKMAEELAEAQEQHRDLALRFLRLLPHLDSARVRAWAAELAIYEERLEQEESGAAG